jgi:hypothetical protein
MLWTTFTLGVRQLTHVEQDQNTNQCVAASLAMICKNVGYSGHRFGEGALFSHGAKAMQQTNTTIAVNGMSDKAFVSQHGIRHNAVAQYLYTYGFANVRTVSVGVDGAPAVAQAINNMTNGDSAILACGVNAFHALAAFKLSGTIYILNPMPGSPNDRGFAYAGTAALQAGNGQVDFVANPTYGPAYWRSVDSCFVIPSQWYLGTVKRWLFG